MSDRWNSFRGVHWVEGHGWFAAGCVEIDGVDMMGVPWTAPVGAVVRSDTGDSGWSANLLPYFEEDWYGRPQVALAHHGNILVSGGSHSSYVMDLTTGNWTIGSLYHPDVGGLIHDGIRFVMADFGWGFDPRIGISTTGGDWEDVGYEYQNMPYQAAEQWENDEWDWMYRFPLVYNGSRYVAVSSTGFIISSTNGLNWQTVRRPRAHERALRGVAEKGGVFVAVGDRGTILRSTDGTTWRRCEVPLAEDLFAVAAGENWFMAVGRNETVLISADGATWQQISVPSGGARSKAIYRVVGFGNGRFLIVTDDGHSLLSGEEPMPVGVAVSPPGAGVALGPDKSVLAMAEGETLSLTASAVPGYEFTGWTGSVVQEGAELTTTVNAPLALTANFAEVSALNVRFREGPPMQEPRMAHRVATFSGQPYLLGGHTTGFTRSGTVERGEMMGATNELLGFTLHDMAATADWAAVAELADGSILVAGGAQDNLGIAPGIDTAMILAPPGSRAELFAEVEATMVRPRMMAAAARLNSGQVLIAGGWWNVESATYGELFTPAVGEADAVFAETGPLHVPRFAPLVLPTADGGAVVAGGTRLSRGPALHVEYYDPVTNTFSILAETVLGDGEPWILNPQLPGDVSSQRLTDGKYLLWGWHETTREGCLFLFDPVTRSFQRRPLLPPLLGIGNRAFPPVLDADGGKAYFLTAAYDQALTESQLHVHGVEIASGRRETTTVPITIAGYFPISATLTGFEVNGRTQLLLAGGSSTADFYQNFHPVARTFLIEPVVEFEPEDPTTIARDFRGFIEEANNVCMARAADGALHVTYTRAMIAGDSPQWILPVSSPSRSDQRGWYSFTRSRNADGQWQPEVRTEKFPDSNAAYSILVDANGRIHQSFKFNVGSFHTQSEDGSSWSTPVPLHDGGWGDWDYEPRLARSGARLFTVFRSCYGWNDFPANLYLREWDSEIGWTQRLPLTDYPNEDAAGYGAGRATFQTRPDGQGVVLYTEHLADMPSRAILLEVNLPHGGTSEFPVSTPGRWGHAGDVAVDAAGVAHVVWREADAQEGPYELWYRTFRAESGWTAPVRVTGTDENSVRTATVGVYGGNRVFVAYGVKGDTREFGGVFTRKVADGISPPVMVGRTSDAHTPGLRSTWDMADPNRIDLTWVEVYAWGSQLMHQEFSWGQLGFPETAAATITSNVPDATFTLHGPVSGTFTLVDGAWLLPNLPAGVYTIVWHDVPGQSTPPPRTFVVTGDGDVELGDSYINENLHRVGFATSPPGAGAIVTDPPGIELLGGDRAYEPGQVAFQARPVEGQSFVRWEVRTNLGSNGYTDNPLPLAVDRDADVVAVFEPGGPFRVETALVGEGTITPGQVVVAGQRFECTVVPVAGQQVEAIWIDGVVQPPGETVAVDPVTGNHSIVAFTEPARAEVIATWLPEEGGHVEVPAEISLNQTVQIRAHPAAGYQFVEWRGDATGTNPTVQILVDRAKHLTAIFAETGVLGDLNDDGAVSLEDAILARRMFAGEIPLDLERADLDGDGVFDPTDVAAILRAEARRERPFLGNRAVAPSGADRLVDLPDGLVLSLPGGWPETATDATLAQVPEAELPPLPYPLVAATPVYDIRLAGHGEFGREIGLEIPFPATGRGSVDDHFLLYLDPESNDWVTRPTVTGGGRRSGAARGAMAQSGKYVVAVVSGNKYKVEGEHCVVYGDTSVDHKIGGTTTAPAVFGETVAQWFDTAFKNYRDANYDVPNYQRRPVNLFLTSVHLDRRATVYLSTASSTYAEAFYNWKTKKYYLPVTFSGNDEIRFTLSHEIFHAIQNRRFTGPGMAANRWLFEMTAEYAARKAAYDEPMSMEYGVWLGTGLGTMDDIHEYACAHFMHYLLGKTGGTFHDLWTNRLATSFTPHAALEAYVREHTNGSMSMLYAHYLRDLLFDTAVADLAQEEMTMPLNGTPWGTGNEIDVQVPIVNSRAAGWLRTRLPPSSPMRVLVELPDSVPAQVNASIYHAPYRDPKVAGGRDYLASYFSGETLPFTSAVLGANDSIYVLAYNYFGWSAKNLRVRIRPLTVTLTQAPPAAVAGEACTFKATVTPIPDSAQQLKTIWKTSDGAPWIIEEWPVNTPEFEFEHTFKTERTETFEVTFELYGLDADGRRRLIVSQTQGVPVEGRPAIQITPSVADAEIGHNVAFAAQVRNGPPNPRFRWTFGDGSTPVTTAEASAGRAYGAAGNYAVTVELSDAADPGTVLASARANAVIRQPVQEIEPPPEPIPAAPVLNYASLRRVDEERWWDGVREVYFLDAAGRKHGLYQAFIQRGGSSKPLDAGMYIHGRREGRWLAHQQDGSGSIDQWHYQWDLVQTFNGSAHEYRTMARFQAGTPLHVHFDEVGVQHMDWPAPEIRGKACVLHFMDGSYETVSFDSQGRRHGPSTIHNAADRLIAEGNFSAGVKTGFWKYFEWSGGVATGVSYNHDKDPPNHE